jgi:ATP-dependent Clp protease ATP-binding subunit ClpA
MLAKKKRLQPISILLAGKTGLGKSEFAKTLANYIAPGEEPFVFGMSQYQTVHQFQPAFFGSDTVWKGGRQGRLSDALAINPRRVIFFDEMDKIKDPAVTDMFLEVLQEGKVSDENTRETLRVTDCILLFAANWAHERLEELAAREPDPNARVALVREELIKSSQAGPWFFGRLSGIFVMRSPGKPEFLEIARRQLRAQALAYGLVLAKWDPHALGKTVSEIWKLRASGVRAVEAVLTAQGYATEFAAIQQTVESDEEEPDSHVDIQIDYDRDLGYVIRPFEESATKSAHERGTKPAAGPSGGAAEPVEA